MQRVCRLSLLILKLKVQIDRRALFQLAVETDKTYISENGASKFQLAVEMDKTYISENGASKFQLAVEMDKTYISENGVSKFQLTCWIRYKIVINSGVHALWQFTLLGLCSNLLYKAKVKMTRIIICVLIILHTRGALQEHIFNAYAQSLYSKHISLCCCKFCLPSPHLHIQYRQTHKPFFY